MYIFLVILVMTVLYEMVRGVDPCFEWGGGKSKVIKILFFGTQYHNIVLCARSAPKIITFCMFNSIFMLNLMVL